MWLQCHDRFDSVGLFDEVRGRFERFSRKVLGSDAPSLHDTDGSYSDQSAGTFMLYKLGDTIVFRVVGEGFDCKFNLDSSTVVEVDGPPLERELVVIRNGNVMFKATYAVNVDAIIPNDPTPGVDDEDFDFGLFVRNISKSPERKDVMLGRN